MPIELTIHEGGGPGRKQVLSKDVVFLGRREDNDVVLPYSFVSSRHGRLFRRGGILLVEDMGSTNGTLVNGEPLTPMVARALQPGDRVQIGEIAILARFTDEAVGDDVEALTYHELPRPAAVVAPMRAAPPSLPVSRASDDAAPGDAEALTYHELPRPAAVMTRMRSNAPSVPVPVASPSRPQSSGPVALAPASAAGEVLARVEAPSTAHLGQTSLSDALATGRAPRTDEAETDPYLKWERFFKAVGLVAILAGLILLVFVLVA